MTTPTPARRDGLAGDWAADADSLGGAVWLNPPYGRVIGARMAKAAAAAAAGATVAPFASLIVVFRPPVGLPDLRKRSGRSSSARPPEAGPTPGHPGEARGCPRRPPLARPGRAHLRSPSGTARSSPRVVQRFQIVEDVLRKDAFDTVSGVLTTERTPARVAQFDPVYGFDIAAMVAASTAAESVRSVTS